MEDALILVIDDEPQIHRFLAPALTAAGYRVARADNGAAALREAAAHPPQLILLDLGLPDGDGLDLIARLRRFSQAPILVVSARERVAEKIHALDAGADDYVEKPFDLGELQARIRVALRHGKAQTPEPAPHSLQAGDLRMDIERHEASVGADRIQLSPREFDLLAMLLRHQGKVVTHRQLLTTVWGPAHGDDLAYLRVYVRQLRGKLGERMQHALRTEPGIGYRLVVE